MRPPRVAYFPDSFHKVNGVAHTSRSFIGYARRRDLSFLCVRAGTRAVSVEQHGNLRTLELPRSAAAVGMEKDLAFDPLFWRHADAIQAAMGAAATVYAATCSWDAVFDKVYAAYRPLLEV